MTQMQVGSVATRVQPAVSRPSDDTTVPFQCENCELAYDDYPALIVVESADGRMAYCTDACAESAGWTEAVRHRWTRVIDNECEAIIFIPAA